mmetsp:Transcript_20933/g.37293  ORF Transcript_20933/g.37293 Transcript_20933/m.37293 type:complete len:521 (+) Transcript_20933:29-1591(+)
MTGLVFKLALVALVAEATVSGTSNRQILLKYRKWKKLSALNLIEQESMMSASSLISHDLQHAVNHLNKHSLIREYQTTKNMMHMKSRFDKIEVDSMLRKPESTSQQINGLVGFLIKLKAEESELLGKLNSAMRDETFLRTMLTQTHKATTEEEVMASPEMEELKGREKKINYALALNIAIQKRLTKKVDAMGGYLKFVTDPKALDKLKSTEKRIRDNLVSSFKIQAEMKKEKAKLAATAATPVAAASPAAPSAEQATIPDTHSWSTQAKIDQQPATVATSASEPTPVAAAAAPAEIQAADLQAAAKAATLSGPAPPSVYIPTKDDEKASQAALAAAESPEITPEPQPETVVVAESVSQTATQSAPEVSSPGPSGLAPEAIRFPAQSSPIIFSEPKGEKETEVTGAVAEFKEGPSAAIAEEETSDDALITPIKMEEKPEKPEKVKKVSPNYLRAVVKKQDDVKALVQGDIHDDSFFPTSLGFGVAASQSMETMSKQELLSIMAMNSLAEVGSEPTEIVSKE